MGTLTTHEIPTAHQCHLIAAEEDVGVLRRAVRELAARAPGLPEGEAELVATELATNLLRHAAPGGYVLARTLGGGGGAGLELIAVDRGPGLPAALRDLTDAGAEPTAWPPRAGHLGVGLTTVRRRARVFDSYSTRDGTVILTRLYPGPAPAAGNWKWAGVNIPLGGLGPSGDGWAVAAGPRLAALVVDGLGHGPEAAAAARAALAVFERRPPAGADGSPPAEQQPADLAREAHQAMRATRGGVLGACVIDPDGGRLVYSGVGNIHGRIVSGSRRDHLISHPGTLGTQLSPPRIQTSAHAWEPGSALILASDGIDTRWDPGAHPGLLERHPAVTAAVIHRDHARGRDDATVLVVRDTRVTGRAGGER
jgi:anti-sigma regulatory factor (Ser/Thr protein kinase)